MALVSQGNYDQDMATVIAAQWADWKNTYQPIELAAINETSFMNPSVLTNAVSEATQNAQGVTESMPGIMERKQKELGIDPTAQQKAVSQRIMNVKGSERVAGAANQARSNVAMNDEALLFGSAPPVQDPGKVLNIQNAR
jgi:hypothetical protein